MKKIFINASNFIKTYDNIFAIILFFYVYLERYLMLE